ncbi:MAG: hypothetical protein IT307_00695 [Chloroflexi bacterium]|nr:hypothetical protein [Chloroflexota bacterium]
MVACAKRLRTIKSGELVVMDSGRRILREYQANILGPAQPGPAWAFLKWVLTNWANPRRCELVKLTPREADPNAFVEFPEAPALRDFDRSDRKFVAAAIASAYQPAIVNATDTDWRDFQAVLGPYGVRVQFLCPELMDGD